MERDLHLRCDQHQCECDCCGILIRGVRMGLQILVTNKNALPPRNRLAVFDAHRVVRSGRFPIGEHPECPSLRTAEGSSTAVLPRFVPYYRCQVLCVVSAAVCHSAGHRTSQSTLDGIFRGESSWETSSAGCRDPTGQRIIHFSAGDHAKRASLALLSQRDATTTEERERLRAKITPRQEKQRAQNRKVWVSP